MNKQEIENKIQTMERELKELKRELKQKESLSLLKKRWRAEKYSDYYYINSECKICYDWDHGSYVDNIRYSIGNYFQTEKEAKFEIERRKVVAELREWATPADEFNWDECSDEAKYAFELRTSKGNIDLVIDFFYTYQCSDLYFKSEEIAKNAIEAVGEDRIIKYYFRRGNESEE